ncbi:Outer membrane protein TolC [Salinimicrobium catena]|uniref:Outer membrane protein TolC n=1 Tax=Salinimicrobium catena TaxID=390640 RepID=A0A1H5HN96_9FLAO|nr:TolC family protein [Salinimicrobium catena]SDK71519.1 Outer membrane protein TolC [Salinimicrobium catena]SEE29486.1 Outer membrane protein TolC [Salinimicrobium catena]
MKYLSSIIFGFLWMGLSAQTPQETLSLSLEEAIALGLGNNYSSIRSEKEVEKALKQKWEIISQGLPQISGDVDYQNFLKQPVTIIPGEIAGGEPGTFVPVRFGTKQNLNGTATWNQLIFDGSYIVGVQSARTLLQISKNAKVKTDLEVRKAVINAYGNVLMAEESVEILQNNLENVEKNLSDTQKIYENGLAEEEDVEQLKITRLGIENNLNRSVRMLDIAYQVLNMALGIPVEKPVTLTEDLDNLAVQFIDLQVLEKSIPVEENIDVRIAANTAEAANIYVRLEKAKALPTLNGFLNYGVAGYSDDFTFFDEEQEYFGQSILGLSLNIPIFSSGMRSSRTKQKELEYEQALLDLEETKNQIRLEIKSAKSNYRYSLENYQAQQENLQLAERIENKNQIKFFEGLASSFELSEAQRQLYAAQQSLLEAMLEVINAKVELENILDTTHYSEE